MATVLLIIMYGIGFNVFGINLPDDMAVFTLTPKYRPSGLMAGFIQVFGQC
jgi:hypothetical protein